METSMESFPSVTVSGNPFEMGQQVGQAFSSMIAARLAADESLHSRMLPFYALSEGAELVEKLKKTNQSRYPAYWQELEGLASGSNQPLIELVLINFRKEILPFLDRKEPAIAAVDEPDQCSDVLICSPSLAAVGHNEDADASVRGRAYLVHARTQGGRTWTAYAYAGELPSCAFGFNNAGIAFSLNAVGPKEVVRGGVARNFVSRDLLEASSLDNALKRAKVEALASGHNYNIMDVVNRRVFNVETASGGRFAQREIGAEPFFHANMYLSLDIPQRTTPSTLQRQERAAEMALATSRERILEVLGDTENAQFPIYMHGTHVMEKGGGLYWTLCTALFDLDARSLALYDKNPKHAAPAMHLPLLPPQNEA